MTRHYYSVYNKQSGFWEVWDVDTSYKVQLATSYEQALEFEKMYERENYIKLQNKVRELLKDIKIHQEDRQDDYNKTMGLPTARQQTEAYIIQLFEKEK